MSDAEVQSDSNSKNNVAAEAQGNPNVTQGSGKPQPQAVQAAPKEVKRAKHPATFFQKLALSVFLLVLTIISLCYIYDTIDKVNVEASAENSTPWTLPEGVRLKDTASTSFHYDSAQKKLIHRGPVTAERKLQLRDLLELAPPPAQTAAAPTSPAPSSSVQAPSGTQNNEKGKPAAQRGTTEVEAKTSANVTIAAATPNATTTTKAVNMEEVRKSYNAAIDNLAYLSGARQGSMIQLLLLLGLFGGALGAVLRSLVDFVGHACYTDQLDLVIWWPLYLTRPIVGAILGFVLVVLFKAKLLVSGDTQPGDDSFWWLGVTVIGGFSTVDVTLRLRLAAKALFGVESAEKK